MQEIQGESTSSAIAEVSHRQINLPIVTQASDMVKAVPEYNEVETEN